MDKTSKFVVILSFLILFLGLGVLWFGLSQQQLTLSSSAPTPQAEIKPQATESAVVGIESKRVLVTKIIDGDTIEIDNGIKVRLLGIDTPETKDPRRSVECFGKQASNETKRLVGGRFVILEKDISETDKYGRLLRYVFLPLEDGPLREASNLLFVNDYLIREGFAKTLTYPPDVKYTEQFLKAQREAKVNKKGLWGRC